MHFVAMVRMHDELDRERIMALADLGIGNGMVMIAFPGHETGKTFTSTIDKVEPEVIRQWAMAIGAFSIT
jgi:hypothetical protein